MLTLHHSDNPAIPGRAHRALLGTLVVGLLLYPLIRTIGETPGLRENKDPWPRDTAFVFVNIEEQDELSFLDGIKFAREEESLNNSRRPIPSLIVLGIEKTEKVPPDASADPDTSPGPRGEPCSFARALVQIPDVVQKPTSVGRRSAPGASSSESIRTILGPNTSTQTENLLEAMRLLCKTKAAVTARCPYIGEPPDWVGQDLPWNLEVLLGSSTYELPTETFTGSTCIDSIASSLVFHGVGNDDLACDLLAEARRVSGAPLPELESPHHCGAPDTPITIAWVSLQPEDPGDDGPSVYVRQLSDALGLLCDNKRCKDISGTSDAIARGLAAFRPQVVIPVSARKHAAEIFAIIRRYRETNTAVRIVAPDTWSVLQQAHGGNTDEYLCTISMMHPGESLCENQRALETMDDQGSKASVEKARRLALGQQFALRFAFGAEVYKFWRDSRTPCQSGGRKHRAPRTRLECKKYIACGAAPPTELKARCTAAETDSTARE